MSASVAGASFQSANVLRLFQYWLREIIRQTCAELSVQIIKGVLSSDHVHMVVSIPPHLALSTVMLRIKGRSSRKVQVEFPDLRKRNWGRRFRGRGYFPGTSGKLTDDIMFQYLELHSKRKPVGISRWWFGKALSASPNTLYGRLKKLETAVSARRKTESGRALNAT